MGSGELTASMVEVHKFILRRLGEAPSALFVDTPAGFQLNVDHIAQKASEYFERRVQHPIQLASYKTAQTDDALSTEQTFAKLRKADYILIGPGSPTYALQQWQQSPIPNLMLDCIERGGCLVAASAAALTVGISTLPVYEIYKVGQPLHWSEGLDLLGHFGFRLVVVPHWNNAEGGNHDTRYCFMGAPRFEQLEAMLPHNAQILGLDEHTALIIDLAQSHATIEGVGRITIRSRGEEHVFNKGDRLPLSLLRGESSTISNPTEPSAAVAKKDEEADETDVWEEIHTLADGIRDALQENQDSKVAGGVLDLERLIWKFQKPLEELNEMGAAREVLREIITLLASQLGSRPASVSACLAPLVESLIELRAKLREAKAWEAADAVRECLIKANIDVTDTPQGAKWRIVDTP